MTVLATKPRQMTADEFLAEFEGEEGKWELVGGEPRMMSGGSALHAIIAGNIYFALRNKLRGTGCLPFNSDMGLKIGERDVRCPDVTVYCDTRDLGRDPLTAKAFEHPRIIFEVLSPTSVRRDRGEKVRLYEDIRSVQLIVIVDPSERRFETYARMDEDEWAVGLHARSATLSVTSPPFEITADEMFALD